MWDSLLVIFDCKSLIDWSVASLSKLSVIGRLQSLQSQVKPHLLLKIACLSSLVVKSLKTRARTSLNTWCRACPSGMTGSPPHPSPSETLLSPASHTDIHRIKSLKNFLSENRTRDARPPHLTPAEKQAAPPRPTKSRPARPVKLTKSAGCSGQN